MNCRGFNRSKPLRCGTRASGRARVSRVPSVELEEREPGTLVGGDAIGRRGALLARGGDQQVGERVDARGRIAARVAQEVVLASVFGCISTQVSLRNDTTFARAVPFRRHERRALLGKWIDRW